MAAADLLVNMKPSLSSLMSLVKPSSGSRVASDEGLAVARVSPKEGAGAGSGEGVGASPKECFEA